MFDHELAQLALRARITALEVATTGSQTLSATATGYARTAGSFLADGFAAGMEVTPTGFTQTSLCVVESVTALDLAIIGGRTAQAAGAGRVLAVKLPAQRGWENLNLDPETGRPYLEEDYVPEPTRLISVPSAGGTVEEMGLYILRVYGLPNVGFLALSRYSKKLLELFPPGGTLALADGSALRYRENPGPWRGQARPDGSTWAVVTVTVPWRAYTQN